jgi:hypothetical protein
MLLTVKQVSISPRRRPESMYEDHIRLRGRSNSLRRSNLSQVASITMIMELKTYQSLSKSHTKVFLDVKCTNRRLRRLKKLWKSSKRLKILQSNHLCRQIRHHNHKYSKILWMKPLQRQDVWTTCPNTATAPVPDVWSFTVNALRTTDIAVSYADAIAAKTPPPSAIRW